MCAIYNVFFLSVALLIRLDTCFEIHFWYERGWLCSFFSFFFSLLNGNFIISLLQVVTPKVEDYSIGISFRFNGKIRSVGKTKFPLLYLKKWANACVFIRVLYMFNWPLKDFLFFFLLFFLCSSFSSCFEIRRYAFSM